MKTSLEHLPERKQRELARVVGIIQEEFADLVERSKSDAKKDGQIFKIILFGSYARGTWVDEPHTSKGYRSDFDISRHRQQQGTCRSQILGQGDRPADVGQGD